MAVDGPCAGDLAITRRANGGGVAWYVGTRLDSDGLGEFLDTVARQAGVEPAIAGLPPGVEAVRRHGPGSGYLFVMNHQDRQVVVPVEGTDVLSGGLWSRSTSLAGGDVAVIRC